MDFTRVAAAKKSGMTKLGVDIRHGDRRAATLFSAGANSSHGLRRTNADKRRAVMVILGDEVWRKRSDRWIAEKCGVSGRFVGILREEATVNRSQLPARTGQHGRTRRAPERPAATSVKGGAKDDLIDREVFEGDDDGPSINPERPIDEWGTDSPLLGRWGHFEAGQPFGDPEGLHPGPLCQSCRPRSHSGTTAEPLSLSSVLMVSASHFGAPDSPHGGCRYGESHA